jgi:hypothetical protein
MKDWMNFRETRKLQFVSHWLNKFEDLVGDIKLGNELLVVVVFE